MKNIKKIIAAILVSALVICSFSSCSFSNYSVKGTWKELDNYIGLYQFNDDGTFTINAVGYVIGGEYEFKQGEQKVNDNGLKTVSGVISMEYKTVTHTDKKTGKEVTEDFYYTYVTKETHIETEEKVNPFNPENVQIVEVKVVEETEHKVMMAGPVTGTYYINEQKKNPETLVINFDGYIDVLNEDNQVKRVKLNNSSWRFERSYDVI